MLGVFNLIYAFHMPLFMMISGYVYCIAYPVERNPEKRVRLYQQIGNHVIVYVVFSIGFGLLKIMFARYTNNAPTLSTLLMIWVKPISPYWYLYDLIVFYLVFSWKPLRRIKKPYMLCILLALSFASSFVTIEAFTLSRLLYYALFFYTGMVLSEQPERLERGWKRNVMLTFFMAVILCVIFWYKGPYTEEAKKSMLNVIPIINVLVGMSISMCLWQIFQNKRLEAGNRFLQMIGRYSLEIYVIHFVFTTGFRTVLPRIGVTNALLSVLLNGTMSTTVIILLAVCTKKWKIHDLFFRPVTFFSVCRK